MEHSPERRHAHDLIERLPPAEVSTAIRFLEFMLLHPAARALATASADDEPITEDERRRFREGQQWYRMQGGKGITMKEVLAQFGVDPENLPKPSETEQ